VTRRLTLFPPARDAAVTFRCTSCGNCCRDLRVAVTHRDVSRLMQATSEPSDALVEWLAPHEVDMRREPDPFVELDVGPRLLVLVQRAGACRFLSAELCCGVYEARPYDCRLYPFDVDATGVSFLSLTECEHETDALESVNALEHEENQRSRELAEYRELVARWNRLARHRRRFRHRARRATEFLSFVGRSS
jgi:Fe-S-cluster containining protein